MLRGQCFIKGVDRRGGTRLDQFGEGNPVTPQEYPFDWLPEVYDASLVLRKAEIVCEKLQVVHQRRVEFSIAANSKAEACRGKSLRDGWTLIAAVLEAIACWLTLNKLL